MNTALQIVFRLLVAAANNPAFQKVALKATRLATRQIIHAVGRYAANRSQRSLTVHKAL